MSKRRKSRNAGSSESTRAQRFPESRKTQQTGGCVEWGFVKFGGEHLFVGGADSAIMVA